MPVKLLIVASGIILSFLPPGSPDFYPIEDALSKPDSNLRRIDDRTFSGPWDVIGSLVTMFNPQECQNYFATCGSEICQKGNALNLRAKQLS
jgi:hypothetical protein